MLKIIISTAISIFIVGCASQNIPIQEWNVNKELLQTSRGQTVTLRDAYMGTYKIHVDDLKNLVEVTDKLSKASGVTVTLRINSLPGINAFAYQAYNQNFVSLTAGMVNMFGFDDAVLANIVGHEIAHISLSHQAIRIKRNENAQVASKAVGVALEAMGVPFGLTLSSIGVSLITKSYSRDEERESDELGIKWAMESGYSPCGFVRLFRKVQATESSPLSFIASHPVTSERIADAIQLAQKNNYGECKSIFE
jgi:predicted Zn-dependent protease